MPVLNLKGVQFKRVVGQLLEWGCAVESRDYGLIVTPGQYTALVVAGLVDDPETYREAITPRPDLSASQWRESLSRYRTRVTLYYASELDIGRVLEMIDYDDLLFGMPYECGNRQSVTVPLGAVEYLRVKGPAIVRQRSVKARRTLASGWR